MKKILLLLAVFVISAFSSLVYAGEINSVYDAKVKMTQLNTLANYDFTNLVNKGELIGEKYSNFVLQSAQYKNAVRVSFESINSSLSQIQYIENSPDFSDADKESQIKKVYSDIETNLYGLNQITTNFLIQLKFTMPSITYTKFVKNFQDYYNSLHITKANLNVAVTY